MCVCFLKNSCQSHKKKSAFFYGKSFFSSLVVTPYLFLFFFLGFKAISSSPLILSP
uniref:Candidate secreted effector n=1 Tax=Meloidogyne incognita TaxID=6306 RepID=A0A914LD79_MELIC